MTQDYREEILSEFDKVDLTYSGFRYFLIKAMAKVDTAARSQALRDAEEAIETEFAIKPGHYEPEGHRVYLEMAMSVLRSLHPQDTTKR